MASNVATNFQYPGTAFRKDGRGLFHPRQLPNPVCNLRQPFSRRDCPRPKAQNMAHWPIGGSPTRMIWAPRRRKMRTSTNGVSACSGYCPDSSWFPPIIPPTAARICRGVARGDLRLWPVPLGTGTSFLPLFASSTTRRPFTINCITRPTIRFSRSSQVRMRLSTSPTRNTTTRRSR